MGPRRKERRKTLTSKLKQQSDVKIMLRTKLWKQSCLRNHQKRNKTFKNFNLYVISLIYCFSQFKQLLFKKVVEFSNIHLYVYLFLNVFHKVFGKNKCPN